MGGIIRKRAENVKENKKKPFEASGEKRHGGNKGSGRPDVVKTTQVYADFVWNGWVIERFRE